MLYNIHNQNSNIFLKIMHTYFLGFLISISTIYQAYGIKFSNLNHKN
jgi:hypothetical protein